jgi:histidyl-tRNA synthetase
MGGGDVPASGFALYLDSLMNIIKPESIAPAAVERILVRPLSVDAMKESFKTADSLRNAGYIAELDLDGQKPGTRWIIEVRGKAPLYTLKNLVNNKEFKAASIDEVLVIINAAKNSLT